MVHAQFPPCYSAISYSKSLPLRLTGCEIFKEAELFDFGDRKLACRLILTHVTLDINSRYVTCCMLIQVPQMRVFLDLKFM